MKHDWNYAVVGNIKKSHMDKDGILRYGTSAFSGNTKVYLCGKIWDVTHSNITVIGFSRGKRYYVDDVPVELIENVRCKKVFTPKVLEIMANWEFSDGWWKDSEADKEGASNFAKRWNEIYGNASK